MSTRYLNGRAQVELMGATIQCIQILWDGLVPIIAQHVQRTSNELQLRTLFNMVVSNLYVPKKGLTRMVMAKKLLFSKS